MQLPGLLSLSLPKICWSGVVVWFCRIVFWNHGSRWTRNLYLSFLLRVPSGLQVAGPAARVLSWQKLAPRILWRSLCALTFWGRCFHLTFFSFPLLPLCADRFSMRKVATGEPGKACALTPPWFILDSCAGKSGQARRPRKCESTQRALRLRWQGFSDVSVFFFPTSFDSSSSPVSGCKLLQRSFPTLPSSSPSPSLHFPSQPSVAGESESGGE